MQLANLGIHPCWYFLFGGPEKSSLAHQYASEHRLAHVKASKLEDYAFKDHTQEGLVVECPATLFRQIQSLKSEVQVVFLAGQLSAEELHIKKDYLKIGRCAYLDRVDYKAFRRAVYSKLIILFGPCPIQNRFLKENYFAFTGYRILNEPLTANDLLSKLPKNANFILTGVVPEPSELTVLDEYFDVQVIHLKHQRTELSGQEAFFDLEARIMPELQKRDYCFTLNTSTTDLNITEEIGAMILPSLVFINASNKQELAGALEYIQKTDSILLDTPELLEILKRKGLPNLSGLQIISLLINIIWKNADKQIIFFTSYPSRPDQFVLLQQKTRAFSLYADCSLPEKYQPSMTQNPSIFFLETHKRKHFQQNVSFEQQFRSTVKYFIISGAQGVGKTSVAKYMCANYGFKHIEYETYLPTVKQKLMGGEEGEEVPFPKIVKHFASLIRQSGVTPIVIDGINIEWKDIDQWVEACGPPTIINLKAQEKQIIKRYRKKTDDGNAQISEDDLKAASQKLAKNAEWADQFGSRCPSTTLYQIDFNSQLIIAEKLIDDILRPRIFLIQTNQTTLFQNIAIRYNMGFYDIRRQSLQDIAVGVRLGDDRNIIISNYSQNYNLACSDFHNIEKNIGPVRYLAIWEKEDTQSKEEEMKLEPPPKEEKPKPAEGEEGDAPPPEEEGEPKKKALDIYEHKWTKPGLPKNVSQWFFKQRKNISKKQVEPLDVFKSFGEVIQEIGKSRDACIYHQIAMKQ